MSAERKLQVVKESATKLHAIDKGTAYDVANRLRKVADEIEGGYYGHVTDVGLVMKGFMGNGLHISVKHYGLGGPGDLMLMVERFRQKVAQ